MDSDANLDDEDDNLDTIIAEVASPTEMTINKSFAGRLWRLQSRANLAQYLIACLSTLGGANHLCNRPKEALVIARKQEFIGLCLGSSSLTIRARVFQAVNHGLMGDRKMSRMMFKAVRRQAQSEGWSNLISFVEASKKWLEDEMELRKRGESSSAIENT